MRNRLSYAKTMLFFEGFGSSEVIKIDKKNELTPPNLALLIKKPEEKKLLWEKMQALLNDD